MCEVFLVAGELVRKRDQLMGNRPADDGHDRKDQDHDQQHRGCARQPAVLERTDHWIEQEGEQDRQGDRHHHRFCPIQAPNAQHEEG